MLKYTFLVYHRQYDSFLEQLRSLGVLHIDELKEGVAGNDSLRDKLQLVAQVDKLIKEAQKYIPADKTPMPMGQYDESQLLEGLGNLKAEITQITQQINHLHQEAKRMKPWGNFDNHKINLMREAGYKIQFFQCNANKYQPEWEQQYNALKVSQDGKLLFFITVNHSEINIDEATAVTLNEKTSEQLIEQEVELKQKLVILQQNLAQWAVANLNNLIDLQQRVKADAIWDKAHLCTLSAADDKVRLLVGFCPIDNVGQLNQLLEQQGIYYETEAPSIEDNTPIKLHNNKFSKLFEPLTGMYGWPTYGELDPTPVLAPFFLLFFALCMGVCLPVF